MPRPNGHQPWNRRQLLRGGGQLAAGAGRLVVENGHSVRIVGVEPRSITLPLAEGVLFKAWSLNGRVPGSTLRAFTGVQLPERTLQSPRQLKQLRQRL